MGLFNFRKKKKSQAAGKPGTPAEVVQQALSSQGIDADTTEVTEVLNRLWNSIDFKPVLPEQLTYSNSAELFVKDSKFIVQFSMALLDLSGRVSDSNLNILMSCAVYWACASEIAKKKGIDKFILKEGQKIAVCDYDFGDHPIYALFPNLLKKTVMKHY